MPQSCDVCAWESAFRVGANVERDLLAADHRFNAIISG